MGRLELPRKGFIRRRGEACELRVFPGLDPVTRNQQQYASRTVHGGKREAQRALAEIVTDAERGQIARTSATVGELHHRVVRDGGPA
jgi:hypothetical protein